ncbi:hypothetical protein LR48_Vigan10g110800 [Vigna angularis]|uniref:Uncharacterized protein n=1 Tax=Phaseolus angularis TaxID=3914 RepID=A0A0L9VJJ2_PHAAN|nr:hypothetical protein LR48_Vigan10g110800 [Vigna angularis]
MKRKPSQLRLLGLNSKTQCKPKITCKKIDRTKKVATAVAVDSRISPTIKTSLQLHITGPRLRRSNKPLDWLDVLPIPSTFTFAFSLSSSTMAAIDDTLCKSLADKRNSSKEFWLVQFWLSLKVLVRDEGDGAIAI